MNSAQKLEPEDERHPYNKPEKKVLPRELQEEPVLGKDQAH